MLMTRTGNQSTTERKGQLYETPAVAVRALLAYEKVDDVVWEPACGPGSIVSALRETARSVIATDITPYGCPDSQDSIDFLKQKVAPGGCKTIVTNPPFELADKFLVKALVLCPRVFMLLRVGYLAGTRWRKKGLDQHIARVRIFSPRLPFMHRAGYDNVKLNMSSAIDFAWFCFSRDHFRAGEPCVYWVNWKDFATEGELAQFTTRKEKVDTGDDSRQSSILDVLGEPQANASP